MNLTVVDLKGVNEEGIRKLVLSIYDYAEQINTVLNSIDDLVSDTNQYFKIGNNDVFQKKFAITKSNFKTVKDNILSYADELLEVKANYQETNVELVDLMNRAASTVNFDGEFIEKK